MEFALDRLEFLCLTAGALFHLALPLGLGLPASIGLALTLQLGLLCLTTLALLGLAPFTLLALALLFETLTLAPFDRRLIDATLLTPDEQVWIDDYHAEVRNRIGPRLDGDDKAWLEAATKPL